MSRIVKFLKTHPKKTLFACAVSTYAYQHVSTLYKNELLRRGYCASVKPLGFQTISHTGQLRRLTVFLNPFARRGRLLKEFDKNVAPLLHLSGLDVQMVYTDSDAEIKDFVSTLDAATTDGILIASDDHVLQKTVSAILQRNDYYTSRLYSLPIGIVPVGIWNMFAEKLSKRDNIVTWCYNLAKLVVTPQPKLQNVLEITMLPTNVDSTINQNVLLSQTISTSSDESTTTSPENPHPTEDPDPQPNRKTYSLLGLEWSVWRDIEHGGGHASSKRKSKPINTNDHLGPLVPLSLSAPSSWSRHLGVLNRHFWFWLFSTRDDAPSGSVAGHGDGSRKKRIRSKRARLVYTLPCDGCSVCWATRNSNDPSTRDAPGKQPSLFSRLFGLSRTRESSQPSAPVEDRSHIVNEDCGREHSLDLGDVNGVTIALEGDHIRVDVHAQSENIFDYFRATFDRLGRSGYDMSKTPTTGSFSLRCAMVQLHPSRYECEHYWIDNDHFEAYPIEVRVRRNAINVFA